MDIKGKTALVTGAATSIGLEYVKELLRNGAQVSHRLQYSRLSGNRYVYLPVIDKHEHLTYSTLILMSLF
jgi:NAD(P)-dependent dehydrogenase (short-subunit alcohol dehydrogenase family)